MTTPLKDTQEITLTLRELRQMMLDVIGKDDYSYHKHTSKPNDLEKLIKISNGLRFNQRQALTTLLASWTESSTNEQA